ncbi:ATP-binding protein [Ruegeria sp. SCP11]|uniref:ATP-binding protein n=1 Tax=Ruegeria sp. SCP11 TaxID=3141378 RepID=UPI00333A61DF
MSNGKCLDLSFAATESEASFGIAQLSLGLAEQGLPAHKAADVKIALAEAINNVVEHAYADITSAQVQVRCRLHKNWLEILISDTGNPLPGFRVPDGIPAALGSTLDELPEGGFGWFLIHELTSDIHYERENGCNRLSLRFDFPDLPDGKKTSQ